MGFVLCYTTPLVISSLGGRHTDAKTQTHTYIYTLHEQDQFLETSCAEPMAGTPGLKTLDYYSFISLTQLLTM